MSDKPENEHKQELQEMVNQKKTNQSVEQVLAVFCQRHGVTMDTCRVYYKQLVKEGKVKEK
jgi:predicted solute-binding protein